MKNRYLPIRKETAKCMCVRILSSLKRVLVWLDVGFIPLVLRVLVSCECPTMHSYVRISLSSLTEWRIDTYQFTRRQSRVWYRYCQACRMCLYHLGLDLHYMFEICCSCPCPTKHSYVRIFLFPLTEWRIDTYQCTWRQSNVCAPVLSSLEDVLVWLDVEITSLVLRFLVSCACPTKHSYVRISLFSFTE
jgi:hypothetical protein